jgi:hypothetical protein
MRLQYCLSACLLAMTAWAGESLNSGTPNNPALPGKDKSQPYRVEVYTHDNPGGAIKVVARFDALGLTCLTNGLVLGCYQNWLGGEARFYDLADLGPIREAYIRFQYDPQGAVLIPGTPAFTFEVWNRGGTRVSYGFHTFVAPTGTGVNGVDFDGANPVAFARVHTTLVPVNSTPPTTSNNADRLYEWKLDSSLVESVSGVYNLSGAATYVATPGQITISKIRTFGAQDWAEWVSLRAGFENKLDGSLSYSQADASPAVTYRWVLLSGPSDLLWSSRIEAQPTVTGLIFGTYTVQLTAISIAGVPAATTLTFGAVATDSKNVVIQSNPSASVIFGDMIAYGKNPWGFMDLTTERMYRGQQTYLPSRGWLANGPQWSVKGAGTIAYTVAGKGGAYSGGTTTVLPLTTASTTIRVTQASVLDLTSFPTYIYLGNGGTTNCGVNGCMELVCISGTDATVGVANLSVCNGVAGRGIGYVRSLFGDFQGAFAWPGGIKVGQFKLTGTGTQFITDTSRPLCPMGPGPAGPSIYSVGTVTATAGSATITGSGTTWLAGYGGENYMIRITGTISGGTPHVWWGRILTASASSITTVQSVPSNWDTASGLSYTISDVSYMTAGFSFLNGYIAQWSHFTGICVNGTAAYSYPLNDVGGTYAQQFVGAARFSTLTQLDTKFSNFYGNGLALRAFYLRSGYEPARVLADQIDEWWLKHPENTQPGGASYVLYKGGAIIGALASKVLNPSSTLDWNALRAYAAVTDYSTQSCQYADSREGGYFQSWAALMATLDPIALERAKWVTISTNMQAWNTACKTADNSWSNGFAFTPGDGPALSFVTGSTTATLVSGGTCDLAGLNPGAGTSLCRNRYFGVASGTATVTTGSAEVLVTSGSLVNNANIIVLSNAAGDIKQFSYHQWQSSSRTILNQLWQGGSGPVNWTQANADVYTAFGLTNASDSLKKQYIVTWTSPTTVTLDRPWQSGPGNFTGYYGNLAGYGQSGFLSGILGRSFTYSQQIPDAPGIAPTYRAFSVGLGEWQRDTVYSAFTDTVDYGVGYDSCLPVAIPFGSNNETAPSCRAGYSPVGLGSSRILNQEAYSALGGLYRVDPTPTNRTQIDKLYGALWCSSAYNVGGVYSGASCPGDTGYGETSAATMAAGDKYPGFLFGVGMAHEWPALRLGGVDPIDTRAVTVSYDPPAGTITTSVTYTAPNSIAVTIPCSGGVCTLPTDWRQGNYLHEFEFVTPAGSKRSRRVPLVVQ